MKITIKNLIKNVYINNNKDVECVKKEVANALENAVIKVQTMCEDKKNINIFFSKGSRAILTHEDFKELAKELEKLPLNH